MDKIKNTEFWRKKILMQSSVRETWLSQSKLHDSRCIHESTLERDFFDFIIFDDGLLDIISQPQTFKYKWKGKKHNYTADFYLRYFNIKKIVEIKYLKETLSTEFKDKTSVLTAFFAELGFIFEVVTEEVIRNSHQAANNRILRTGLNHPKPIDEFKKIKKTIPNCHMNLIDLVERLKEFGFKPCFIRRALAHQLISADLKPRWSEIQIIW
jgi:hypothetical protein